MSLSGVGVLSFDHFGLGLSERVTFVVGPNGAGKSNLARLLTICQRAVEGGDGAAGDVDRLLAPKPRTRSSTAVDPSLADHGSSGTISSRPR
jgi:predicted ATPase